jgi:cysteine desulfurase
MSYVRSQLTALPAEMGPVASSRRAALDRPRRLYFDNNATTPLLPRVRDGMFEASTVFGNPSSAHLFGEEAAERVEEARRAVAELLGCTAERVVFNSGGSEGASSAILGTGLAYRAIGGHIITSAVEHPAVLGSCEFLVSLGFELTVLPVDGAGRVEPGSLRRALRRDTRLVSVMHANNETGTLQPVEELAQVAREAGVTFHCDAVQSAGKVAIPVGQGLITISAHKFHGPKGVGAMVKGTDAPLQRLVFGGEQEHGLRPGTENVLGVVGLGLAAQAARLRMADVAQQARRREVGAYLRAGLASIRGAVINSPAEGCLPETVNVSFCGLRGDTVVDVLSARGVAASTGSACHSDQAGPSRVLVAMGLSPERARGAVRFSASFLTTREEIDQLVDITDQTVRLLRSTADSK